MAGAINDGPVPKPSARAAWADSVAGSGKAAGPVWGNNGRPR